MYLWLPVYLINSGWAHLQTNLKSANDFPSYSMAVAFTDRQLAADSAGSGGHQINQRAHLNMDIDTLSGRSEVSFEIYLT